MLSLDALDMYASSVYKSRSDYRAMISESRQEQSSSTQPLLVDKAFFGKDNCLSLQVKKDACFMKWGRKAGSSWEWKTVKFSDVELGELLALVDGTVSEAKFFHSFGDDKTQLWFTRKDNSLICKAGDFTKGLSLGEMRVFGVLLRHSVWMMNLA